MVKHRHGAGRYVLVLREHDEEGRGYSLELAPLAASDAPPSARGRASTREAEAEAAATATGTGTGPRAQGSSQTTEEATGGALSRVQGLRSTRDAATVADTTPRGRGDSPGRAREAAAAAGRPPRPRGSHAGGLDTTVDVAEGAPRGGDGDGGGSDAADAVRDDIAGASGERILDDMRILLFSQPQNSLAREDLSDDVASPHNRHKNKVREREVLIPVFLSPKKKGKNNKDEIWNKRQIMYGIALLGLLGFVPVIVAFLPKWALFTFAAVWGFSSIGFPFGLYGTSKLETGYSRHMGRLVFMGFCLSVIFMLYQYMALTGTSLPSSPVQPEALSPPPSSATHSSPHVDIFWTIGFACVGGIVMVGHIVSWVRGCMTGSDKDDESESSGEEDTVTSDLLQRLLDRR